MSVIEHCESMIDVRRHIDRLDARIVQAMAREHGVPGAVIEATYRAMIDAFIAFETREFARLREGAVA